MQVVAVNGGAGSRPSSATAESIAPTTPRATRPQNARLNARAPMGSREQEAFLRLKLALTILQIVCLFDPDPARRLAARENATQEAEMNARVTGWLSFTLARLVAGASPVDGFHGFGSRSAKRKAVVKEPEQRRRPGQTQFVRGLS